MVKPELIASTGDQGCDKIVRSVIGIFESTFRDRVRGYYLRGSRASGTSIEGSDIDLFLIFKDRFDLPAGTIPDSNPAAGRRQSANPACT